jgi:hypothetical protein
MIEYQTLLTPNTAKLLKSTIAANSHRLIFTNNEVPMIFVIFVVGLSTLPDVAIV